MDRADSVRVRRSELATPASSLKMLAKSVSLGADLVFMDLEDACAPNAKIDARRNSWSTASARSGVRLNNRAAWRTVRRSPGISLYSACTRIASGDMA